MSESQSTPDQESTESSNRPAKAKPILRKDGGQEPRSEKSEDYNRSERGGNKERGKGKGKGKGRDRKDQQEPQARVNPALMRGPKVQKPKPEPEPEPVVEEETTSEATDEVATDSSDTSTEDSAVDSTAAEA